MHSKFEQSAEKEYSKVSIVQCSRFHFPFECMPRLRYHNRFRLRVVHKQRPECKGVAFPPYDSGTCPINSLGDREADDRKLVNW
jgi:hypothetical protein